jgi:transposase InsO family protein
MKVREQVKALVIDKRKFMPRIGTRKLHFLLAEEFKKQQLNVGRDKLFSFLRHEHLLVKPLKSYTKTTYSKHWLHKHPNLVKGRKAAAAERLWVSDITYLKTKQGYSYLSLVTDAASRKIMGYYLSPDLRTENVMRALQMALRNRTHQHPLIHHSDRGLQYCADEYQQLLRSHHLITSMTDGYDCYQNALAERINGILKTEFLLHTYDDIHQADRVIAQSIHIYNTMRPHLSLQMKTPEQVHNHHESTEKKSPKSLVDLEDFFS